MTLSGLFYIDKNYTLFCLEKEPDMTLSMVFYTDANCTQPNGEMENYVRSITFNNCVYDELITSYVIATCNKNVCLNVQFD